MEREFQSLYSGEELSPLRLQYKDYSEWQNSTEQQEKRKEQELYWLNQFNGEIPILNLPIDYVRPVIQSYDGATVRFALSKNETDNIKEFAEKNGLTLYMSILSVFTILLSKLSCQEDIIIGTPIAGRNHADLEQIVGMFVNTLAIRIKIIEKTILKIFLKQLKQNCLNAFENQDFQFDDLVEKLVIKRDSSRNPLFNVMLNLFNQKDNIDKQSEYKNDELYKVLGKSKFDLTLFVNSYDEFLEMNFIYNVKLFKEDTIIQFTKYFKEIIKQLTEKIDSPLSEIYLVSDKDNMSLANNLSVSLD
ncbi:MAG: hypothetical protein A2X00_10660 [Bacteroidetes bacterium GWE2_32_14]|nr:MAG: hypothetical protein A2X00_10660 [Bacteroidetes bacterium GWE2_32_14]